MNSQEAVRTAGALKESGAAVIHEFETFDQLAPQIQHELDNGKAVVFIPRHRTKGFFYTAESFGRCMKERMLPRLSGYRIVIEPDFYGYDFILAVMPVDGDEDTA